MLKKKHFVIIKRCNVVFSSIKNLIAIAVFLTSQAGADALAHGFAIAPVLHHACAVIR